MNGRIAGLVGLVVAGFAVFGVTLESAEADQLKELLATILAGGAGVLTIGRSWLDKLKLGE